VFFVTREQITMRDRSEDEVAAIHHSRDEFESEKTAMRVTTSYGMSYSRRYARRAENRTNGQYVTPRK
jgi:hypothetical protein